MKLNKICISVILPPAVAAAVGAIAIIIAILASIIGLETLQIIGATVCVLGLWAVFSTLIYNIQR